jgi:hypothetical protein
MTSSMEYQLLTTEELLELPPPRWLMQDLIPDGGFVGLYGAPGSGKSFVALDWAMCISEGRPWLGRYRTKQAPVIYVAAEGGRGIQQRVSSWIEHHQIRPKSVNQEVLPAIYFLLHPIYVREEGAIEAFIESMDRHARQIGGQQLWPGLLVLDTLSRSFGGGEENSSVDMGHFVDRMTALATQKRMATLIVHHQNAEGKRERGHTSFRGAADAMFKCEGKKDDANVLLYACLRNDKQKDGPDAPPIYLEPRPVDKSLVFEWMEAPATQAKRGREPQPMRTQDMKAVLGASPQRMTWGEWRASVGIDRDRFNKRLRKLLQNGEVEKYDDGRYAIAPAVKDIAESEE